jgi:hypothetical protein
MKRIMNSNFSFLRAFDVAAAAPKNVRRALIGDMSHDAHFYSGHVRSSVTNIVNNRRHFTTFASLLPGEKYLLGQGSLSVKLHLGFDFGADKPEFEPHCSFYGQQLIMRLGLSGIWALTLILRAGFDRAPSVQVEGSGGLQARHISAGGVAFVVVAPRDGGAKVLLSRRAFRRLHAHMQRSRRVLRGLLCSADALKCLESVVLPAVITARRANCFRCVTLEQDALALRRLRLEARHAHVLRLLAWHTCHADQDGALSMDVADRVRAFYRHHTHLLIRDVDPLHVAYVLHYKATYALREFALAYLNGASMLFRG